jgi:hypothetical protein
LYLAQGKEINDGVAEEGYLESKRFCGDLH